MMLSNLTIDARSVSVVSQYLCGFLTTMVILQIPMTANTHDISAPDAGCRHPHEYAYFLTIGDRFFNYPRMKKKTGYGYRSAGERERPAEKVR